MAGTSRIVLTAGALLAAGLAVSLAGCVTTGSSATTQPSAYDQARSDPMNYNPDINDWPSVSGGGISHFDKNAFNRDVDHVLNP